MHLFTENFHMHLVSTGNMLQCLSDFPYDRKVAAHVSDIPYPAMMLFRYNKRMSWRERAYIKKSEISIIFINLIRLDFTSDYLTEDAIFHACHTTPYNPLPQLLLCFLSMIRLMKRSAKNSPSMTILLRRCLRAAVS